MTRPNPHIALIYHYDLARALNGEPVDWQAIPVNVDAGREGGDLCRAAADFAKRRDLFAMPSPTNGEPCADTTSQPGATDLMADRSSNTASNSASTANATPVTSSSSQSASTNDSPKRSPGSASPLDPDQIAAPAAPNAVGQPVAEPEPTVPAQDAAYGSATNLNVSKIAAHIPMTAEVWREMGGTVLPVDREKLRARIAGLIDQGHASRIRREWPEGVPTLVRPGHTDDELAQILAAVRRVETEVGAGWHPDDGPPPHVNTDPRAEVAYPAAVEVDEGGPIARAAREELVSALAQLDLDGQLLVKQITHEAWEARRSISLALLPSERRYSIARAVIAWAAAGHSVDDLWFTASLLATHQQTCDADATLGGLISQFTIEQGERLYEAAGQ